MDAVIRNEIAESLERLADQPEWNPEIWQRCYESVERHWENELLAYVFDDIVHYSGEFHSRNIFFFRVKADRRRLDRYRQEFRDVAAALRACLSLSEARKIYDL
jgi:hypothetical protein